MRLFGGDRMKMVMFTLAKTADNLHLTNPVGILVIYLGFGAGLAVFMLSLIHI